MGTPYPAPVAGGMTIGLPSPFSVPFPHPEFTSRSAKRLPVKGKDTLSVPHRNHLVKLAPRHADKKKYAKPSAHVDDENMLLQIKSSREVRMKGRIASMGILVILIVLSLSYPPDNALAEVNLNINIGPPPVVVAEPADVVLMPGSGVYFVADTGPDLFFYAGFWWSPRGDRWYRSRVYNGPWVVVGHRNVPVQVVRVPRDYRTRYKKAKHVPYGQWKKAHYRKSYDKGRHGDDNGRNHHKGPGKRGRGHDDR